MTAIEPRRRQVEQAVVVLINQAAALFRGGPALARDRQGRLYARSLPLDHRQRLARLGGDHRRHAGLEDAGLLGRDLLDGVAEEIAMIECDARDHAGQRPFHHIGGIEPAAEADFQEDDIGRMPAEQKERRRRLDLEHGDRQVAVLGLALCEHVGKLVVLDQRAATLLGQTEAFVEADQIGRRVGVHAPVGGFENRARERDGRAFAVGASHMNDRWQPPFRMVERRQQALDAGEREIDPFGVQRQQARMNGADRRSAGMRCVHAGAGRLMRGLTASAGAFNKRRQSRAIVARRSRRCTTMSTMP